MNLSLLINFLFYKNFLTIWDIKNSIQAFRFEICLKGGSFYKFVNTSAETTAINAFKFCSVAVHGDHALYVSQSSKMLFF